MQQIPQPGQVVNGYRFRGGDPSQQGSWEFVPPLMRQGDGTAVRKELEAVRGAGAINDILGRHRQRIENGELNLGALANGLAPLANGIGLGDDNSRNYQSLRSDLERMRNQSLRLNSGVQTEGDAQRAWNELFGNLTDEPFVLQRMAEIEGLNDQAIAQRRSNIDAIRIPYGFPEVSDGELFPESEPDARNDTRAGLQPGYTSGDHQYMGGDPSAEQNWQPHTYQRSAGGRSRNMAAGTSTPRAAPGQPVTPSPGRSGRSSGATEYDYDPRTGRLVPVGAR